jgi:hypothetical protein
MKNDLTRFATNAGAIISVVLFFVAIFAYDFIQSQVLAIGNLSTGTKWVLLFSVIYIGAQFLAALLDIVQGRVKAKLKNLLLLWFSYLIFTFLNLFILFLCLPILAISFILGPALGLGGLIGICLILVYLYHHLIDSTAIAHPPSHQEVLIFAGAIIAAFGVLYLLFKKNASPDQLLDGLIDYYVDHIYKPVEAWNKQMLQNLD